MYFEIFFDTAANAAAHANGIHPEHDSIEVKSLYGDRLVFFVPWHTDYREGFKREMMDRVVVDEVAEYDSWD